MAIANITNNILTDSGVATSALQIALNGTGFVKIVGTTISYDNSTYLTTSAAASTYVALTGNQTIAGVKTFSNNSKFDGALILKNNVSSSLAGYVGLSALSFSGNKGINIDFDTYSIGFYFNGTLPYNYTFPNANGTVALTSDIPDVSGYVTLITAQTITGAKTFTSALNGTSATFSSSVTAGGGNFVIHSNGNASIGNPTQIGTLYIAGNTTIATNANIGSNGGYMTLQSGGGNVLIGTTTNATGLLQVNGTIYATGFFESSSIKGKDIIATNPLLALDIDVIKYTRKSDESKDIRYGYSAEQIHSLMPELTDKDVTAVKYLDVHTILISQLQQEIKELKAKMN
jgi:hypothetical protein